MRSKADGPIVEICVFGRAWAGGMASSSSEPSVSFNGSSSSPEHSCWCCSARGAWERVSPDAPVSDWSAQLSAV